MSVVSLSDDNVTMTMLTEALTTAPTQTPETTLAHSWLLGFDTETTGVAAGRDAIVSAALVLRNPAIGHDGDVIAEWIINPHRKMTPGASRINGFTDAFLAEHGQEPTDAIERIADLISQAQRKRIPLVAYNAPFDVRMLTGDLHRWNLRTLEDRFDGGTMLIADPLVIDRAVSRRSGKRTLEYTAEYYGVEPDGDFHNATADTITAVDLIEPMTTLYPQVGHITIRQLMEWQRDAHQTWRNSYNRWLAQHGRRPVNDSWL